MTAIKRLRSLGCAGVSCRKAGFRADDPAQGAGVKPLPGFGHRKRACALWAPKESVCPVGTSPKAKANWRWPVPQVRGTTVHLAPMEQAGSKDFAEGESELEVACSTSEVHDSAPRANGTGGVERLRRRRKQTGGERFNKHRARQRRVRCLCQAGKRPNVLPQKPFSESKRIARRAMKRALAETHRRFVTGRAAVKRLACQGCG